MPAKLPPFNPNPESPTDQYFRKKLEQQKIFKTLLIIGLSYYGVGAIISFCLPLLLIPLVVMGMASLLPSWIDLFIHPNFHWPP